MSSGEVQAGFDRGCSLESAANSLPATAHSCFSRSSMCISTAQDRKSCWRRKSFSSTALVALQHTFSGIVITFTRSRKGTLMLCGFKPTFRCKCKIKRFYLDVHISWQASFGHVVHVLYLGEVSRQSSVLGSQPCMRKLFLWQNLDEQVLWQAQHFVDPQVQISWQAQHFVNLKAQIV